MNLSPAAEITRDALVAEFAAAVTAASNAGELGHSAAEEAAFVAQAAVNRIALRLGLVDAVEAGIREAIGSPTFVLSRDREELGL